VFRDGPFVVFLALHLAALSIFVQFQLTLPLDMGARGLGPAVFAALMAVNGIGVVVLQPLQAAARTPRDGSRLLATSALLFGVGYGVNALAGALPALPVYLAGTAVWTLGEVVGFPVAAAFVADLAPAELRGRYQGAFSMSWGVAFALAPLAGGEALSRIGAPALWIACLCLGAAVALGHLVAGPSRRRRLAALRSASPGGT
jgi:hypothetical protein